jgi:hypothetical protein
MPGQAGDNPCRPWEFKASSDCTKAAHLSIFVDDIRVAGPSKADCWEAHQRTTSILGFLGAQDAAHKRRGQTLEAGAFCFYIPPTKWRCSHRMTIERKLRPSCSGWMLSPYPLKDGPQEAGVKPGFLCGADVLCHVFPPQRHPRDIGLVETGLERGMLDSSEGKP